MKYKNIILLVNDINRINLDDFAFGLNRILVIEDNEINREKLKYLYSIRWKEIVDKFYKGIYLSEYTNNKDKFINMFYFIDTEKITILKYFIRDSLLEELILFVIQSWKQNYEKNYLMLIIVW